MNAKRMVKTSFVPDWAYDAIWYQVFPERFRNGCAESNPQPVDAGHDIPGWQLSSWTGDWYAQDAWEKEQGGFYDAVFDRRYGGDLVGLQESIPYLKELGVNALYLNPVFMARSLHKYEGSCYHHIDPAFGPDREGDLRRLAEAEETHDPETWIWTAADMYFINLVKELHSHGFHIIIDGVFNHVGRACFAFQDVLKKGRASYYSDWFTIKKWHKDGTFEYDGWWGVKDMPEWSRSEDQLHPGVQQYIFDATQRWMDPRGDGDLSYGVDGWRLDVAFCVPHGFWKVWSRHVKRINPDAYTTGELIDLAPDYVQGDELDALMNYVWAYHTVSFFVPGTYQTDAVQFKKGLETIRRAYPEEVGYVVQNLYDSHDTARILTSLKHPDLPRRHWDEYFNLLSVRQHASIDTSAPGLAEKALLRQLLVFQAVYLGAPMLYYGTEAGMWGASDPDDRQPMLWDDMTYDPEQATWNGMMESSHPRQPDKALYAFVAQCNAMRTQYTALRRGSIKWKKATRGHLAVFQRRYKDEVIRAYFNAGREAEAVTIRRKGRNIWTNKKVKAGLHWIPAGGWLLVRRNKRR